MPDDEDPSALGPSQPQPGSPRPSGPSGPSGPPLVARFGGIGYLLSRLGAAGNARFAAALAPLGLRPRHFGALAVLEHTQPATQQTLANALGVDRSTLVAIADHLEAIGAVSRRRDSADRRRYALELTEHGRTLLARCKQIVRHGEEEGLAPLSQQQREQLLELLSILAAHLPNLPSPPASPPPP
jgi:DNA-binding MarR family transcriptional regulator